MESALFIGKPGTGKTTLLKRWFLDDVYDGKGAVFFDFHGSHIDNLLSHIPSQRQSDVILFDPSDTDFVPSFNVFDSVDPDARPLVAQSVVSTFKSITGYTGNTPVLDRVLYNSARLCLDSNESFLGMFYLLTKEKLRKRLVKNCTDPTIKDFWKDYEKLPPKERRDFISSTQSNLEPFITDITTRNVIGQIHSSFQFKDVFKNKILMVRLPRHILGAEKTRLLGLLLLSSLHSSAPHNSDPFKVYIDNSQVLMSPTLLRLVTDLSDFDIGVYLTIQQLSQLKDIPLLDTVNTLIPFRIGIDDSKALRKVFAIGESAIQLHELDVLECKMATGLAVSSVVVEPHDYPSFDSKVVARCRSEYAKPRDNVEQTINRFLRGLK